MSPYAPNAPIAPIDPNAPIALIDPNAPIAPTAPTAPTAPHAPRRPPSAVVPADVDALPVELGGAEAAHEEMGQVRRGDDPRATAGATDRHLVGLRQRLVV